MSNWIYWKENKKNIAYAYLWINNNRFYELMNDYRGAADTYQKKGWKYIIKFWTQFFLINKSTWKTKDCFINIFTGINNGVITTPF